MLIEMVVTGSKFAYQSIYFFLADFAFENDLVNWTTIFPGCLAIEEMQSW
jgi:hypothetical protein